MTGSTVHLKTDDAREPGTIIAELGDRVVVFWHWAQRQWIYTLDELELA